MKVWSFIWWKEGSLNKWWGRAFLFPQPWLADKANQIAHTALPQQNKNLAILINAWHRDLPKRLMVKR